MSSIDWLEMGPAKLYVYAICPNVLLFNWHKGYNNMYIDRTTWIWYIIDQSHMLSCLMKNPFTKIH